MSGITWHLAQVNIGRARGAITDAVMHGFVARLEEINALAERTPGFVWRLQTEDGDATAVRPYPDDDLIMINMSVWANLESLRGYVFRSPHAAVMRQRREWFGFHLPASLRSRRAPRLPRAHHLGRCLSHHLT